ncbi:MAG: LysM domain-containing protein [Dehalococcoidia bacterium]
MDCYACDQPAVIACKRCAKPYCEDHGNQQYCAECLHPASALPSFNLYRGSLLTMLVGTALAVFLLIRPPGETTGAVPVVVGQSSPTPTASGGDGDTPAVQTPRGTSTPAGTPTPAVEASPTVSPFLEYVIQDGDSLFLIAQANVPAGDDVTAYVEAIANLNGLNIDDPVLTVGETLLLPPLPEP